MTRTLKPIRSTADYDAAQARAATLVLAAPKPGTPAGDELDILATLISAYDHEHFPLGPADPIAAISFAMDQRGLAPKDLVPFLGTRSRVSEVLNGKRGLTVEQIARLHYGLAIPFACLMPEKATMRKKKHFQDPIHKHQISAGGHPSPTLPRLNP